MTRRTDYTLLIRGKEAVVSIDRLKPAILPCRDILAPLPDITSTTADKDEPSSSTHKRSGRTVRFKTKPKYAYF